MKRISAVFFFSAVVTTLDASPIHAAVLANDPSAVRAALADGADANEIDDDGQTPLMEAVLADHLRAAAALMKMGADSTIRGSDGMTPLHVAAHLGFGKIVKMMLRYDVDTTDTHSDGLTAFHRACQGAGAGHTDAVFAFLEKNAGLADAKTEGGERPIQMAGSENTRKLLSEYLQEQRRRR